MRKEYWAQWQIRSKQQRQCAAMLHDAVSTVHLHRHSLHCTHTHTDILVHHLFSSHIYPYCYNNKRMPTNITKTNDTHTQVTEIKSKIENA